VRRLILVAALLLSACGDERDERAVLPGDEPICGSDAIRGGEIGEIEGRGTCGIADPVRVTSVAGIRLSPPARLNCKAARALQTYVSTKAIPLIGDHGGGLEHLEVAASYACRSRNSQGGRLSEHARGNAIDISAYHLADGSALVVERDWGLGMLKSLHREGCGIFGTVLGPASDRFHHNHFHFDVADYRSGPYCQ
jgi:hypothetical protein